MEDNHFHRVLTVDLIPQLTASLVGFIYLIGGIKPGVNSLHVRSVVHGSENGTFARISKVRTRCCKPEDEQAYTRLLTPPPCIDESLCGQEVVV